MKGSSAWARLFARQISSTLRKTMRAGSRPVSHALKPALRKRKAPVGKGDWLVGIVMGPTGARRYRIFRPPGIEFGERLPLMVMLHGCHQDASSFAASTRMNVIAARERFLVLYPEQDRLSNAQGCWNWFDTKSGQAYSEAASIMQAIDQACVLYPVDRERIAVAGLSAGASMAALLVTRYPTRFKALAMHSGIPPGTAHSAMSAVGAMYGQRTTKPLHATESAMSASWPPLLVIHGGIDKVVSTVNGQAAAQLWADAAGARAGAAREVQRGKRYPMSVTEFKRRAVPVATLVQIARLGHAWSGGAASGPFGDSKGPDASRMVWAFAARQFRSFLLQRRGQQSDGRASSPRG